VAQAGDANGDGYDDALVGAIDYRSPEGAGAAFLYVGSPAGLTPDPAWTALADQLTPGSAYRWPGRT
jgi:hypothetical protein